MPESFSGVIERVVFHNLDTGFAVLRVQGGARRGEVTVVGALPNAVAGEYIEAVGEWVQNREHGLQFKAEQLKTTPPHTPEGIERYLGSGLVKGIGRHFARKIVEVFGERTLDIIDASPTFLAEVRGIGRKRIQRISESWQQQKGVRSIMMFFQQHGVGMARAVRIYKEYGDQAIEIVQQNPYRLATDIWGVGFQTADELALKMSIDRNSPQRAQAALRYVLQEYSSQGHVGYPESGVIQETVNKTQISPDTIRAAVEEARTAGEIVRDTPAAASGKSEGAVQAGKDSWLFLKPLFLAEAGVARGIQQLQRGLHPLQKINVPAALEWVEKRMKLKLADRQRAAIEAATREKVLVITGGPGVGKTTIVRGMLEIFSAKGKVCELCAPTGRAAKRLSEATGRKARTIHRMLEFEPHAGGFRRNRDHPLELDLLVVDESSMVDISLMNHLLRAVPPNACVVFVGDVDQLPSVGPGSVLADLIASDVVPVVRLTEIFRQAEQSWIVRAAHAVNHGEEPASAPDGAGDFFFMEVNEPATIIDRIITMVRERIPKRFGLDPLRDVQVLSPMNKTDLGVIALNQRLQQVMNPQHGQKEVQKYGQLYREGDKVMQIKNNYDKDVFNGDIGRITKMQDVDHELLVEFDGREVSYDYDEVDELTLAYCTTIHKSQGGEYPAVVIPLHTQHFVLLQRNLLYTGITRGRKLVVLVGSRRALQLAIDRQDTARRCSLLRQRLTASSQTLQSEIENS